MTGNRLIKVCGMTEGGNIRAVEALGVDLIGFIFYPASSRFVRELPSYLPEKAGRVGVFVNADREEILRRHEVFGFSYVQLHGDESPEFCARLRERDGLRVIKAFGVADEASFGQVSGYESACDLFLFDTRTPGRGGSGQRFDWSLLDSYQGKTRFLLSGGLGPESAEALRKLQAPLLAGLDLNSRFETAPGIKDPRQLELFLEELNR
jgi:phosphoribosylanthranilate isomerase